MTASNFIAAPSPHHPSAAPTVARPIATWRHTALLVGILLLIAWRGASVVPSASDASGPRNNLPLYVSLIVSEMALVYAVWAGTRRSGTTLRTLTGGRWRSAADVARDVILAALFWVALTALAGAWDRWGPFATHARSLNALLPKTVTEMAAWIVVSLVAGFAEELVFRGYFQRQFEALTRRPLAALALQAVLFGVSHGYQGVSACVRITVIGAMFGALALWRRSLRPGMLAHAWTDIASGIFRI